MGKPLTGERVVRHLLISSLSPLAGGALIGSMSCKSGTLVMLHQRIMLMRKAE